MDALLNNNPVHINIANIFTADMRRFVHIISLFSPFKSFDMFIPIMGLVMIDMGPVFSQTLLIVSISVKTSLGCTFEFERTKFFFGVFCRF